MYACVSRIRHVHFGEFESLDYLLLIVIRLAVKCSQLYLKLFIILFI